MPSFAQAGFFAFCWLLPAGTTTPSVDLAANQIHDYSVWPIPSV